VTVSTLAQAISGDSVVVVVENQVSVELAGETVILNLGSGMYYGLDPVGARIWELLQEPRKVDEIRDLILAEYEVEPERCERDLITLLEQLTEQGLINAQPHATTA